MLQAGQDIAPAAETFVWGEGREDGMETATANMGLDLGLAELASCTSILPDLLYSHTPADGSYCGGIDLGT